LPEPPLHSAPGSLTALYSELVVVGFEFGEVKFIELRLASEPWHLSLFRPSVPRIPARWAPVIASICLVSLTQLFTPGGRQSNRTAPCGCWKKLPTSPERSSAPLQPLKRGKRRERQWLDEQLFSTVSGMGRVAIPLPCFDPTIKRGATKKNKGSAGSRVCCKQFQRSLASWVGHFYTELCGASGKMST